MGREGGELAEVGESGLEACKLGAVDVAQSDDTDVVSLEESVGVDAHHAATADQTHSQNPYHYQLLPGLGPKPYSNLEDYRRLF